jgi:hypothetical protein
MWKDGMIRQWDARRAALVALLIGLSSGCGLGSGGSNIQVRSELLPWGDVARYHAYAWWAAPLEQRRGAYGQSEALLDWRVRDAVDRGLQARGYVLATTGKPDFIVAYRLSREDASTSSFRDYLEYRVEGGRQDMGESFIGYERGTLALTFEDAATRRFAWRATTSAALDGSDGRGDRIGPAVGQMLERFPAAAR